MAAKFKIAVLYSDESLLIVNKPAGIPTLPDGYVAEQPDLVALLTSQHGALWVVHRLDRETSGVLALARNEAAHRALNTQFESRDVAKVYHAIVNGHPAWDERSIAAPLRPDADRYHRTLVDHEAGKPAVTHCRVLERFGHGALRLTLIEARPETGRTHQIRVHLMTLGFPVAVDALYSTDAPVYLSAIKRQYRGDAEDEQPLLGRLGLHALQLTLRHPVSDTEVTFEAPYPKDIAATLNQLRKHAAI
jgi:RluA family pseudouridine synthase